MSNPFPNPQYSEQKAPDPYLSPSFSLRDRLRRQLWNLCWAVFYRTSPRPFHTWRAWLLKFFGAKMGPNCHFYPKSKVWAPWNLICEDQCTLADDAEIYNPAPCFMGSHAIVSQEAYICGATHDYNNPAFPLISFPMRLGAYSWVCARACVSPGVNLGPGSILGLASIATKDLEAWSVYAGAPARKIKARQQHYDNASTGK